MIEEEEEKDKEEVEERRGEFFFLAASSVKVMHRVQQVFNVFFVVFSSVKQLDTERRSRSIRAREEKN